MDTPLHSRDKEIVKKVDFWRLTGSEKGEDSEIGRQGDGHGFLSCPRNHLQRLLGKRTNDNERIMRRYCTGWGKKSGKKRPHLEKILFHQDNARVRTCAVSVSKIMELKFELLRHPPYSPDLAPEAFFNFQTWKTDSADNGSRRTRSSPKQMPIFIPLSPRNFIISTTFYVLPFQNNLWVIKFNNVSDMNEIWQTMRILWDGIQHVQLNLKSDV